MPTERRVLVYQDRDQLTTSVAKRFNAAKLEALRRALSTG